MALIEFKNLPDTTTPINAENLNNNFTECNNIVESGSNANGTYIKYSDGTMICARTITGTVAITETWGSGCTSGANSTIELGNWATPFISTPIISVTPIRTGGGNYWLGAITNPNATAGGYCTLLRFNAGTSVNYGLNVIGIGRWK